MTTQKNISRYMYGMTHYNSICTNRSRHDGDLKMYKLMTLINLGCCQRCLVNWVIFPWHNYSPCPETNSL